MTDEMLERRCFDMTGSFDPQEAEDLLAKRTCRLLRAVEDTKRRSQPGWHDRPAWDEAMATWFGFPSGWAFRKAVEGLVSMGYLGAGRLCVSWEGRTFSDQLGESSMAKQIGVGKPGDSVAILASVLLR